MWQDAVVAPSRGYTRSGTSFVIAFSSAMTIIYTSLVPMLFLFYNSQDHVFFNQIHGNQQGSQTRYVGVR